MSRLTVKDIAAIAGVSTTTVSRVLNDREDVSPRVREHVQAVIRDNRYRPLASATSLASRRNGLLGFIVPLGTDALFDDPYFSVLIRAFSRAAAKRGTALALFLFDVESDQDNLVDHVIGPRRVDGVVVSAFHTRETIIDNLADYDVPTVTIGPNPYGEQLGSVLIDNAQGGLLAGRAALAATRGSIGMIGAPKTQSGVERFDGFMVALGEAGFVFDPQFFREGDYSQRSGEVQMRSLIEAGVPDVVFIASDTMAVGAISALRAAGKRVPEDVALVGFDDLPSAAAHDLTTVRQPIAEVADLALDILSDLIGGARPASHPLLPVSLISRGSTRR